MADRAAGSLDVRRADLEDGVVVLSAAGRLNLDGASRLHAAISKAIVDLPRAILVRLDDVVVCEPVALSVFAAAAREADEWTARLAVVCSDQMILGRLRSLGLLGRIAFGATVEEAAVNVPTGYPMLRRQLRLPAGNAAPAESRAWLRATAGAWGLSATLAEDALVVLAELVTNAVVHVRTGDIVVHLCYRAGLLRVTVRDSGPATRLHAGLPRADAHRGRGLLVVNAMSRRWGVTPVVGGGKGVWAVLPG